MRAQNLPKSLLLYSRATSATSLSSDMNALPLSSPDLAPASVVLDTNVVLDCFLFCDPAAHLIACAVQSGQWNWISTLEMQQELTAVVVRPELARWQSRQTATLAAMLEYSESVESPVCPAPAGLTCSDSDDQMFIDLAWSRRVACLFTRDKALLGLARRARIDGVLVLRPSDWPRHAAAQEKPQAA